MIPEAEKIIINRFGIPEIDGIKRGELILKTNDKTIPGTDEEDYYCNENSFKFCLVKEADKVPIEPIFSMDFLRRVQKCKAYEKKHRIYD
ncbi:hypothetical protein V2I71_09505 [Peribacillus frigoritolerans]|uniref:hypothetical protein n=1 Tax=Peribacillus frigoritolerans TaxID=450367 RepID=UPI002ED3A801|nr:hypothetical protein V2I71_09505 [Peribacillus frigoritolerans]